MRHLNSQSNQKQHCYKMSNKFLNPQHNRPTFEQFEALLTRHLEKRLTAIQEKFESYLEKSVKQLQI